MCYPILAFFLLFACCTAQFLLQDIPDEDLKCSDQISYVDFFAEMHTRNLPFDINFDEQTFLGQGTYGFVHRVNFRDCAFVSKCLKNNQHLEIFVAEYNLQNSYQIPNVGKLYGLFRVEALDLFCMAMGIYDGDLEKIRLVDHFSPQEMARMAYDLSVALSTIHEDGLLFLDLKPANVLVSLADKELVLVDFGLANEEGTSNLCTPKYSGFEAEKDRSHDVFGFGEILLSFFTPKHGREKRRWGISLDAARRVFNEEYYSKFEDYMALVHQSPTLWSRIPRGFKRLIEQCTAYIPAKRPFFDNIRQTLDILRTGGDLPAPYRKRRNYCKHLQEELDRQPDFNEFEFGKYVGKLDIPEAREGVFDLKVLGCSTYAYMTKCSTEQLQCDNPNPLLIKITKTSVLRPRRKRLHTLSTYSVPQNSKNGGNWHFMIMQEA